eukprot:5160230-Pleurochrysis_carterae.AAC.1
MDMTPRPISAHSERRASARAAPSAQTALAPRKSCVKRARAQSVFNARALLRSALPSPPSDPLG